ncbi:hypothetical protein VQ042_07900 [Aurantimonas sp. A2-1-M11]|uniref:hypothetical protein n=1 Tax=Aurantimonas sp. A2-1-M11 TaxID=3113712 RepID=UPI002F952A5D
MSTETHAASTPQSFPPSFRHVRLELAREKGHPDGDSRYGYDILVPLDTEGRIDPAEWKPHQAACRVRHFQEGQTDLIGRLRRKPGGTWYFDYQEGPADDEIGFHFDQERFVPGEYVSIRRGGDTHTYQVKKVGPL